MFNLNNALYLRWTQLPLTGLRKLGYRPWGFSILFSSFLMFITCKDTKVQKNITWMPHCHGFTRSTCTLKESMAVKNPTRVQNFGKIAVNCPATGNVIHIYTAPSPCRWDSLRAPTDGQIPGEEYRTQPGCCSRLRPSPSSNWCHCNRDNIQRGRLSITAVTHIKRLRTVGVTEPVFVFMLSSHINK